MKLAVYSHCTVDEVSLAGAAPAEAPGGGGCYCSVAARRLGLDVDLFTRFGADFPAGVLERAGVRVAWNGGEGMPTARFRLDLDGSGGRTVRLVEECGEIPLLESDADGALVRPMCGGIARGAPGGTGKGGPGFLMLDAQGFARRAGEGGLVSLGGGARPDLSAASAVKVGPGELAWCAPGGRGGAEGMAELRDAGAGLVLYAERGGASLLDGDRLYSLRLPDGGGRDATGAGDVMAAAFACTMLREDDPLWALCFAGGAAQAAIESGEAGPGKVPSRGAVQTNAAYYYNTVKFRGV